MWSQLLFLSGALTGGTASTNFQQQCSDLQLNIPDATVYLTQFVKAGTNLSFPDNDKTCTRPSQIVSNDLCRVALLVKTSSTSNISMEAWLPENWSGRFLSTGNGGISGCIQYEDLAYAAALGFSAVGTNNGHNGTSGKPFYKNPETVIDFGHRAMHTGVVVGKQISNSLYRKKFHKSYYLGCSTGGRQGMKAAQKFPNDFDGIVAGAPAVAFNNLTSQSGTWVLDVGAFNSSTWIPLALWPVIHQEILRQCDSLDGVADGILEDPSLCNFRPESLICSSKNTNTSACITPTQASALRTVYAPIYGNRGALVFPATAPGGELNGLAQLLTTGKPFPYTEDWFRYVVYDNPNLDLLTLNPDDFDAATRANPGDIQTWDLVTDYQEKGGKLLHYHGQADPLITPYNSPRYYDYQARGLKSSNFDDFYRFFRISGMGHCSGGQGAWMIGQNGQGNATLNPDGNILMAMVRWVEEGIAPDTIQGTKYVDDQPEKGVSIVRRHCRYPLRNVYRGPGPAGKAENWECVDGE